MNRLSKEKQAYVIHCLLEGMSIRSTVRLTGVAKNTITKLLVNVGNACWIYQKKNLQNLKCTIIQCDEIWSFCHTKEKNKILSDDEKGSVWTWVGICAETKLVPYWHVGSHHRYHGMWFMRMLANRLDLTAQITTDGLPSYPEAVDFGFKNKDVNYGIYEKQYSGSRCVGIVSKPHYGNPEIKLISTSFSERQNLTMRMSMRRFTRKTNAFSKKLENHKAAIALYFMWYNFIRVHETIKTTPAIAAGVENKIWSFKDIIDLIN